MSSDEIVRYRDIVSNDLLESASGFDPQKICQNLTKADDEAVEFYVSLDRDLGNGILVKGIGLYVGVCDIGDGEYVTSDLYVNYVLLDDTDMTMQDAIAFFYYEEGFHDELRTVLLSSGFSAAAVGQVDGTNVGIQDDGRASYDGTELGHEVRASMAALPNSAICIEMGNGLLRMWRINPRSPRLESQKDEIIKDLLRAAKLAGKVTLNIKLVVDAMSANGIRWPELNTIAKSAKMK